MNLKSWTLEHVKSDKYCRRNCFDTVWTTWYYTFLNYWSTLRIEISLNLNAGEHESLLEMYYNEGLTVAEAMETLIKLVQNPEPTGKVLPTQDTTKQLELF